MQEPHWEEIAKYRIRRCCTQCNGWDVWQYAKGHQQVLVGTFNTWGDALDEVVTMQSIQWWRTLTK